MKDEVDYRDTHHRIYLVKKKSYLGYCQGKNRFQELLRIKERQNWHDLACSFIFLLAEGKEEGEVDGGAGK